jgi:hypothetical protein
MTTTADPHTPAATNPTPQKISRLEVPEVDDLENAAVRNFFAHQQREEGLTSNWFRALSLNDGDLGRLNGYLLPLLGADGRGGLTAREREVIATSFRGRTGAPTATPTTPTNSARSPVTGHSASGWRSTITRSRN